MKGVASAEIITDQVDADECESPVRLNQLRMIKKQSSRKITPKLRQESFPDDKAITPMSNRRKEAINETRPLLNTNMKSTFSS